MIPGSFTGLPQALPPRHRRRVEGGPIRSVRGCRSGDGLFVSEDRGHSFRRVQSSGFVEDSLVIPPDFASRGEAYAVSRAEGFVILRDLGAQLVTSGAGFGDLKPTALRLSANFAQDGQMVATSSGGGVFRTFDRGRSWSEVGTPAVDRVANSASLALSPAFATDPAITTDLLGTTYLAWADARAGNFEIFVAVFDTTNGWRELGTSSATRVGVSNSPTSSRRPSIAITPDGRPVITYTEFNADGTASEVRVTRFDGTSWTAPTALSSSTNADHAQVVGTAAGATATWHDSGTLTTATLTGSTWSNLPALAGSSDFALAVSPSGGIA